jgi:hypothetical protein
VSNSKSVGRPVFEIKGWVAALAVGCLLAFIPAVHASLFPVAIGSGSFSYNGTSLSLNSTSVAMITYEDFTAAFMSWQDPVVGGTLAISGVTRIGSSNDFTDGAFTITAGGDVVLQADIINVTILPTATHTGNINPSAAVVNLANVQVSQPSAGSSRFVTDWLAASEGSGYGKLGFTLTNTAAGSIEPLVAPAGGPVNFQLEPALASDPSIPEPATVLFLTMGCGAAILRRRR